ncbi:hypothetical protein A5668_28255 [Mycolicibacterium fortuitum]|nr:hypothetical protein A5668_28255 [Mycolicibacterium fortuitum]
MSLALAMSGCIAPPAVAVGGVAVGEPGPPSPLFATDKVTAAVTPMMERMAIPPNAHFQPLPPLRVGAGTGTGCCHAGD